MSWFAAWWPVLASLLMAAGLVWWWIARRRAARSMALRAGSPRQTWFPMGTRDSDLDDEADHADRSGGDDSVGD